MKRSKTTRGWILFCYILAVTNASPGHRSHFPPEHGHPRSILSAVPPTIQIPEHIMSRSQEVSCVSADINIFEILNEAKQACKGNDLHVQFYYYSNQKYYYIGACDVNKELFDSILMKYDHWLITGERINLKDTVTNLPDHILEILNNKVKKTNEIAKGKDEMGGLVVSDDQGIDKVDQDHLYSKARKTNNEFDSQPYENSKEASVQENSEKLINTAENKDKYENYLKLKPNYDRKNKYFEIFLPKDNLTGKERTVNVEIDNGTNNIPLVKETDEKSADNVIDADTYSINNDKDNNEANDLAQSFNENEEINIENDNGNSNERVETSLNEQDSASEINIDEPQTDSAGVKIPLDNFNDHNKQYVIDSQSNNDKSESINFSNNVDMPNISTVSSDDNLEESSYIHNTYKSDNDRSMQDDQVNNLKLHLSLKANQNYLNEPQNNVHKNANLLKHEDKSHITEVLHHNPNENIFNPHDDIFEDHVSTKQVQINGENPYIYNPHDFEDSHEIALHEVKENHIHLNEPVYKINGLSRESDHMHAPYIFKLPKIYSLYPQPSLEKDHGTYLDSIVSNQPSQLSSGDSLTSNLIQPIDNLDLGELSRSVNPNSQSQTTSSSAQDILNYFKDDFTQKAHLDMDLNYQSLLPNVNQDRTRLPGSLQRTKFLNPGLQNTHNVGYNSFPSNSLLNKPSFRLAPNTNLFIDRSSQQSDSLPNINDKQIIVDNPESICDTNSIFQTDLSSNLKYPGFVDGIKESLLTGEQRLEGHLKPQLIYSDMLNPKQFAIPEAPRYIFSDEPSLGKDSSFTSIPCSLETGIGLPQMEPVKPFMNPYLDLIKSPIGTIPKNVYLQNVLDNLKQHPYISNPRFIQPYVPISSPTSEQVCPSPTLPFSSELEGKDPNLIFGVQNMNPISQLPQNLFWNNPRQYICPNNPFSIPSKNVLQNLQGYPAQSLPIGIPQFKNPHIPSPIILNNNFDHHDSTESLLQQDFLEPSLLNSGSILNKPLSLKPCFSNLPPHALSAERPFSLPEGGSLPCFNLPLSKEYLITPSQKLTPLTKVPIELTTQTSQVNAQLLPNQISTTTFVNDSPLLSTANTNLNNDIQSANIMEMVPLNPTASSSKEFHAPPDYFDSSLLPPSILSPCLNNAIKTIPSDQHGSDTADNILKLSSSINLNPVMFHPSKIPNFIQTPFQNYLDSSLLPPSILSPCLNPEFKTQTNVQDIPQYGSVDQNTNLSENIRKQPSSLSLQPPMQFSSSYIPTFMQVPTQNYEDSFLMPPNILTPCFNPEIKTQPTFQDKLSQFGSYGQVPKLADHISKLIPHLKQMQYSPKIPNFIQAPCENYLDSSLLPPSIFSPYLNNETPPNIQDISQYDSDVQIEMADSINKQTPQGLRPTQHVPTTIPNYIPPTQNYLDSSLLPPSILSPCLTSEMDTLLTLPNIQSMYQSGDYSSKQLPPLSLHPVPYSPPKIPNYKAHSQDYLDSSLLPPSILSPCLNPEIQMIPFMEGSNYFSGNPTGLVNNINQRPTLLNLKQANKYSPMKMPYYNQNLPQLKQQKYTDKNAIINEDIYNTPFDTMTLNNYPLQNPEIIRGPSPCAQQISPLDICEGLLVRPDIPSLYNIPSLMSAFPNIFAPKHLQSDTIASILNSVSPDVNIDYSPPGFSSGFKLANPAYSQLDNQIIPSSLPTICSESSSNIQSYLPYSPFTLPLYSNMQASYPNGLLPSSLIGPSLKPSLWPNVLTKYPIGNYLPPNLVQTSHIPQANAWAEGMSINVPQDDAELHQSLPNGFSSVPSDTFFTHINPESIANLYDIPLSPKLLFLNKPLTPQKIFNPYTFSPIPCHSSTPNIPQTSPTLQSIESIPLSLIPCPTSHYMPPLCDSQTKHSLLPFSNYIPQSPPLATNKLSSIPTPNHNAPCFTLDTDQFISLPNSFASPTFNVEAVTSQPSFKSTAYNSQINNKEYLSIPHHNIDVISQSPCEDSLPSHLTNPSLDSIIQVPSTEQSVSSSAPESDITLLGDSVSELNTYPYSPKINKQQNHVPKLESLSGNHQLSLDETTLINSDSIKMTNSESKNLIPLTESSFMQDYTNKEISTNVTPWSEQSNLLQNIGKSMDYDKLSTDFKITDGPTTNLPFDMNSIDNTNEIVLDNFAPIQSEFIDNNLLLTKTHKVKPPQTTQLYENTNQYKVEVSADALPLHQSSPNDDDIEILPTSFITGSSILSNTQEIPTLNVDVTKAKTSLIKPSDRNAPLYTTLDTSQVIMSSDLQPPSLSDLKDLTLTSDEFISKEFIPHENQLPFLDTTLQGSSLPTILSSPLSQSSKNTISFIDRNMPYDSRPKSLTWPKEYLKDSRSYEMLGESQPTYQYIPSSVDNILPQSDYSETSFLSQLPCNYQGPSTLSYLPLDRHLLQNIESQLDFSLLPNLMSDLRPLVDTKLPCDLPIPQRPETIETYNPYILQSDRNFPSNNDFIKLMHSPKNIANIPQNIATLPYSDFNAIINGMSQYRPLYTQPCGLDTLQPTVPMIKLPSLNKPQAVFPNLQTNTPIYNQYSPIFSSENPVSEPSPCLQELNKMWTDKIPYAIPTHSYQIANILPISPCSKEKSTVSTSNMYLTSPFEISPPESLYSSEYMPTILPPTKSIPQFKLPSYSQQSLPHFIKPLDQYSYQDCNPPHSLNIPNDQYKLLDLQSLGDSNSPLIPISVSSPLDANRFISPPISIEPQYNIISPIPQVRRVPVLKQKFVTLPCIRPQVSTPLNIRPAPSSQPLYKLPIAPSCPLKNISPVLPSPQYTLPLSQPYSLPIQPSYTKPQSPVSRPIYKEYWRPLDVYTRPQLPVICRPISPSYTTISPVNTPKLSPSTVPFGYTPSPTNPQFSVISSPISSGSTTPVPAFTPILPLSSIPFTQSSTKPKFSSPIQPSYTTLLQPTSSILSPSTTPFIPPSTSHIIPCTTRPITTTYKSPLSYINPSPNYKPPLPESYSYLPSRGTTYRLSPVVTSSSYSPYVPPTSIKRPLPNTYVTPISPIVGPQSNIVPQKYSLPLEYINSVFIENKPIQKNPFMHAQKYRPLPSYPNKLNSQSNISLKPYLQPLKFTPQAAHVIPQKAVLYPISIPSPEFIKYSPQSMKFSPLLNTKKSANLVITEPILSSGDICQESYETGKEFTKESNIPLLENPVEIDNIESIINENTPPNTTPINSVNNFSQNLLTPCTFKQSIPSSKLPFSTSAFSLPYYQQNIPGLSAISTPQFTLSSTNAPSTCISPPISSAPMSSSEKLPSYLEYPYDMGPIDIRQKPPLVDNQANRFYTSLPSTMIPNYQETNYGQIPSSPPKTPSVVSHLPQYNPFKLTPASLSPYTLPPSLLPTCTSNLPDFVSQAPQSNPFTLTTEFSKFPSLPSYTSPHRLPLYPKLSPTSSTYTPPSVTYPEQVPRHLQIPITQPSTASYNKYSSPILIPVNKNPFSSYPSQKQLPGSPQYLKLSSVPINTFAPISRPCFSQQFIVPSSITNPLLETDIQNPELSCFLSPSTPKYLTPQLSLQNVAPPNVSTKQIVDYPHFAQTQEIPISSELLPCPFTAKDNMQESKLSSIQPLVSESLTSQEYLDAEQLPLSARPISLDKGIQLTSISKPCSPRYRQVDLPKELKDLLQKMSKPNIANYQYAFSNNQFGQTLPRPTLDAPLSNVDVSEMQPLASSSGILNNLPSPQLFSVTDLNNLQNIISNVIHKPMLPQYTISNLPIYGSPISSLYTPKIPCNLSSESKPNYISLSEPSNTDYISSDSECSEVSQANSLPGAIPVTPCFAPFNKPTFSLTSQKSPILLYSGRPTANLPTDSVFSQASQPIPFSPRPTFIKPKWFQLPCRQFLGNNNQIIPNKLWLSSLQGPSVLGTDFEDNSKLSVPNDVEYNSPPLQSETDTEYATQQPISVPTLKQLPILPVTPLVNEYKLLPTLPCSEKKPNCRQFGVPQLIPAFMSPYSYTSKRNPAKKLLPTPSTSQSKLSQPTYPCTSTEICQTASPSQMQSPLSYSQPYLLSDIQKILGPITNSIPSSKYENLPLSNFETDYISPSSDEMSLTSPVPSQYTQVNPIQLIAALNKDLKLQAANYPHYLPCNKFKPKENYYAEPIPSISTPLPVVAEGSSSLAKIDNLPVDIEVDILPNSLQNPQLSTIVTPQYDILPTSPVYPHQNIPLNSLSSSYIQSPSTSHLSPSILSGSPPPPLFIDSYPETLQSPPCQSSLPAKPQNWSLIPNIAKSPPIIMQPNWWYQNGRNIPLFMQPPFKNPCAFNFFTPYENIKIKPSSQITPPEHENQISERTYDLPKENTDYVNLNKYTETPSNNKMVDGSFKEIEIDKSIPTDNPAVYSEPDMSPNKLRYLDNIQDFNEGYYTDVDFNPYENLNNLQGPNPECKYILRQPQLLAPFGKNVPEDYISALNIPNISTEENSFEDSKIERVKLPTYVYNRNIDNTLRNVPKYKPINTVNGKTDYKILTNNINTNQYNDLSNLPNVDISTPCNISPNEHKTNNDKIQKPTTLSLYPNLYNAPYQGNYYENHLVTNKPQEFNNQPVNTNYKTTPIDSYRNPASSVTKPLGTCNDFTEIPTRQFQYYPQTLPDYCKNNYPQIMKPFISSNAQIPSLEPYELLDDSNDYSKVTPCVNTKPCQLDNLKYSGYKTYQMPNLYPNIYQEPPTIHVPKSTQPISTIADYKIPIQNSPLTSNLDFENWQQSSNLNEGGLNNIPVCIDNEIKTNLINYLKQRDQKDNVDTKELTIPIRKFAIVKPLPCSEHTIQTKNPSLGLKVWKSNIKVVEAEIKLRFKDLSVINFMPIVNNLDDFDIEEIKNIAKSLINEKYGDHFDVNEPYVHSNEYQVIKELDKDFKHGQYKLLWPTKCVNA